MDLPPVEFLRECFDYDPDSGAFHWRWRPDKHFQGSGVTLNWNNKYAGEPAFVTKGGKKRRYFFCSVTYQQIPLRLRAGRVAYKMLTGDEPLIIDHINGNPSDNRAANLRSTDRYGNIWNRHKDRGSLPRGAYFDKKSCRWLAKVSAGGRSGHGGRTIYLGSFGTAEEAHRAWRAYTEPRRGEFFNPGANRSGVFA